MHKPTQPRWLVRAAAAARRLPGVAFWRKVSRRATADRVGEWSAGIAFYLFLSLFPLLLLGLAIVGAVLSIDPQAQKAFVLDVAGEIPGLEPIVRQNVQAMTSSTGTFGVVGFVVLVYSASRITNVLRRVFAEIFRAAPQSSVRARIFAVVATFVFGGAAFLGFAILTAGTALLTASGSSPPLRILAVVVSPVADAIFFLAIYRVLAPSGGPALRDHVPGALFMLAAWTTLKIGGTWYVTRVVPTQTALYGAIGGVIVLLLILWMTATAILYGAEVSAVRIERRNGPLGERSQGSAVVP